MIPIENLIGVDGSIFLFARAIQSNANKGALVSETQTARAAQHMRAVVHGSKIILCMQAVPRSATPKRMCHRERRALRSHLTCSCQSVLRILFPSLLRLSYWSVVGRIDKPFSPSRRNRINRIDKLGAVCISIASGYSYGS